MGGSRSLIDEAVHWPARPAGAATRAAWVRDPFVLCGAGATIVFTAAAVAISLRRNDGHLVYAIDDAAIHLNMAETLVHSGTWGVEGGTYESASSSPGWTLLLAATAGILPRFEEWVPLLLTMVAAVVLLTSLGRAQTVVRPGRHRLLDGVVAAVLAISVLFLPGLAATGMEHAVHAALVVVAVDRFSRVRAGDLGPAGRRPGYLALALAAAFRFETLFLAAGLGLALLLDCIPRLSPNGRGRPFLPQLLQGAACGLATAVPIVAFGAVNIAMGQSFWPNSVLSKTALGRNNDRITSQLRGPYELIREVTTADVVVLLLIAVAAVVLVWAWYGGPRRQVLAAAALLVTVALHTLFAEYGYFERYQAYLIAFGVYLTLSWASEAVPPARRRPAVVAAVVLILVVSPYKLKLQTGIPLAMNNTYNQRYQAGLFLDRYYGGRAVSTSELGYISLLHDGPLVDLLGLGSHDVLVAREDNVDDAAFWQRIMEDNRVEVVATYPFILPDEDIPRDWELVAQWRLRGQRLTGPWAEVLFFATGREFVEPLRRNIDEFATELPGRVETICVLCLTELAEAREAAGEDSRD